MTDNDTSLDATILSTAKAAKKIQNDEMIVEEHSLDSLIAADAYLEKKTATSENGIRRFGIARFSGSSRG